MTKEEAKKLGFDKVKYLSDEMLEKYRQKDFINRQVNKAKKIIDASIDEKEIPTNKKVEIKEELNNKVDKAKTSNNLGKIYKEFKNKEFEHKNKEEKIKDVGESNLEKIEKKYNEKDGQAR